MQETIRVHVKLLQKGTNEPFGGSEYVVKFYDKNLFRDDYLGESDLDDFGHAIVSITCKSPLEEHPDLYFKVFRNEAMLFESKVFKKLHLEEFYDYPASGGLNCKLGTFYV